MRLRNKGKREDLGALLQTTQGTCPLTRYAQTTFVRRIGRRYDCHKIGM